MTQLIRGWTKHLTPPVPGWQRTDPLDRGLVGEWRFDPATGLVLLDYSGYGNRGVVSGATWTTTSLGPALSFAGGADKVECGNVPIFNFGASTDFSIEMIYQATGAATDTNMLAKHHWAGAPWAGYDIKFWFGRVRSAVQGVGGHFRLTAPFGNDGLPHHVVMTCDRSANMYLYLDAVPSAGLDISGVGNIDNNQILYIGRWQANSFTGEILFTRIYRDRVFSAAEVQGRYEICLKRTQPMTHVWMMLGGMAPVAPPVGGHMTLWGRYWGP